MTTERETLHTIGLWLEEGRTRLPDRVLDAVLDQLPATPQRRPSRPARGIPDMSAVAKFEIAAAAVLVAVVGFFVLRGSGASEVGNAPPAAVYQAHLGQAGLSRGLDVVGDDARDVARRERVQVELGFDRDMDRFQANSCLPPAPADRSRGSADVTASSTRQSPPS